MERPVFIEYWNRIERMNLFFGIIIILLSISLAVLGVSFYKFVGWQKVILVPPQINEQIVIGGDETNAEYVRVMIKFIGQEIMEYTPMDIDKRINTVLFYVSPTYYRTVKESLEKLGDDIKQSRLNQMFRLETVTVTKDGEAYMTGNIERYVEGRPLWSNVAKLKIDFKINEGKFSISSLKMKVGPFQDIKKDQTIFNEKK